MYTLQDTINKYRIENGVGISCVNADLCDKCRLHSLAMARERQVFHAPIYYLEGFREIVAAASVFKESYQDICNKLIFGVINSEGAHKNDLLSFNEIGHYLYIDYYCAYLTIRGK